MHATTIFLAVYISCLLFLSAWKKMSGSGKLQPGPVAFPIIGNALQLNMKNLSQSMCEVKIFISHLLFGCRWRLRGA
uniref:Uncharacterized protein n=1 Tax=Gopherus evgoodei TaxID=1825980 RepID=A0A8C4WBA4_9SAUR